MKTLFAFDLHILREDPAAMRIQVRELFETLKRFGAEDPLWSGINPCLLLTKFKASSAAPFVIRLPIAAERELRRFSVRWDDAAVEAWCDLMRGEGRISELYCDILQWLVNRQGIECIAYWGSNGAIRRFCESVGVKSVAMELGPTRPPFRETRYCDFMGVNGDASTRLVEIEHIPPMDVVKWRMEGGLRYDNGCGDESRFRPLAFSRANLVYGSDRPCALIVLQLDDDSNCLVHSRYSGMLEMVEETVPKFIAGGWRVFVKPHPGAAPERNLGGARRRNVVAHEAVRTYLRENFREDEAVWLDDVSAAEYTSLIDKMDAVVSVNSSVGFEAMLCGKVVVALGRAPYAIRDSLPSLDAVIGGKVDRTAYLDYASRVANLLLNHYLYPASLLSNPGMLAHALWRNAELDAAWRQGGSSALTESMLRHPVR